MIPGKWKAGRQAQDTGEKDRRRRRHRVLVRWWLVSCCCSWVVTYYGHLLRSDSSKSGGGGENNCTIVYRPNNSPNERMKLPLILPWFGITDQVANSKNINFCTAFNSFMCSSDWWTRLHVQRALRCTFYILDKCSEWAEFYCQFNSDNHIFANILIRNLLLLLLPGHRDSPSI